MSRFAPRRRRSALERRLTRRVAAAEAVESEAAVSRFAVRPASESETWVDLLHHAPIVTTDLDLLRSAVRFGFESGDAGGLLTGAVDEAASSPSHFGTESFATGLFLKEIISGLLPIIVPDGILVPSQAFLARTLSSPPDDPRDVVLRQEILAELCAKEELHEPLVRALETLRELRNLLDDRPMSGGETVRRKIEVLQTLRRFFELGATFHGASSALKRFGEFAKTVTESDAFTRLVDLLRHESKMTELQVRLVLDYEGKIRDYEVLEHTPVAGNPVVRSTWRRVWERILGFLRGHRYGEHEVILRIIDDIFEELEDAIVPSFALIGHLEFYASALAFRARVQAAGLDVCLPSFGEEVALEGLFNPLLLLMKEVQPVPCALTSGKDGLVLITGPNSGGKTRVMQSLALTQLFAQSGYFVPAKSAALVRAPKMFVSLIEGAPADHKEGRLGTELLRVRKLFEELEPGCLVILDELCSGTNPSEGIAIFEMVLSLLPRIKPRAFLTTHFLDAARRLQEEAEASNSELRFLQVELDDNETPTYQFVPGVAPTSLAHAVAARLGVTQDELEGLVSRHD